MKITIDLEEELFAVISQIARRTGYAPSQVVADLVRRGLSDAEGNEFEEWEDSSDYPDEAVDTDYEP